MKLSCRACIARPGVFLQFGREQIAAQHDDVDPDALYRVFVPPEVLAKVPDLVDAVPIVDDSHDFTDAPDFNPGSVIGLARCIRYRDDRLWAYLSFWHPASIDGIKSDGARQLSLGFRAAYERQPGEFNGEPYDFLMTELTALDHVALVPSGEMGDDCALPRYEPTA
jgi:hypothetical protein